MIFIRLGVSHIIMNMPALTEYIGLRLKFALLDYRYLLASTLDSTMKSGRSYINQYN